MKCLSCRHALAMGCLLGFLPFSSARAQEVTLETQLNIDKPGATVAVGPSQVVYMPPKMRWEWWDYSPMWVDKPRPISRELPKGWSLKVEFSDDWGRSVARINVPEGTDLYGTGEVLGPLRRNNTKIALWNTDNYVYRSYDKGRRLYQSHPWVMGVRDDGTAFGVLADTTWRATLEITDTQIIFDSEGPVFPVLIIEGKDPSDVLRQLAERTGFMEMPPLWALGYQQCRWSYDTDKIALNIVKEFRQRQIPADVIWMDIDYMDGFRVFTFSPKNYPDPKAYSEELHKNNFKGVWMIDPGVKVDPDYAVFKSGTEGDHWVKLADQKTDFIGPVWPGNCKFPDFTRAETREWWKELNVEFVTQNGIDGIWNDMNEPAVFTFPNHTMHPDNHHRGDTNMTPGPHLKYHNVYGMLMLSATREGLLKAQPDKRPFTLTRGSFLGGQRYGATWTGDNESSAAHMNLSIPMSITLGLSGQPFNGPDVGGFGRNCTAELLEQWTSFGAFFPFFRNHAAKGTRSQEPWAFGPETEAVVRTSIERRYRLLPYLYTAFRQSSLDGSPVMRPLFFADVKDKSLRGEQGAFMVGGDLVIVPAIAKNPALPKGDWRALNILETKVDSDSKQAKVLLRPGSIVPIGELVQSTEEPMLKTLTLAINPGPDGTASGTLYEDAGNGFGYKNGDYRLTTFSLRLSADGTPVLTARHEGKRASGVEKVVIRILTADGEKRSKLAYSAIAETK